MGENATSISTPPQRRWVGRLARWDIAVPCLIFVLLASPNLFFMLPNTNDVLQESHEPMATLRFVHSRGRAFFKWGPMSSFVYAPVYAPAMAYWYLSGQFGKPFDKYPFGFTRPHEQMGALIATGRLTSLVLSVACMGFLGWALARVTGSRWAAFLALLFCVATGPEVISRCCSTKPDGLMLAFLAAAMGVYALVVSEGLTLRKGVILSILAVFSISSKEQTAPVFVLPYLGIAVMGWFNSRADSVARRRLLVSYATMIAVGLVAYALVNIVYAPATWRERMTYWLSGPGKDPEIWARSDYTTSEYLLDVGKGLLYNLDAGALAVVGLAVIVSALAPVRSRLMYWLPTIGYVTLVILTAGYMPTYFLLPVSVTAALPVAASLAYLERARLPRLTRLSGVVLLTLLAAFNLWGANKTWAGQRMRFGFMTEQYCLTHVNKSELVYVESLWKRWPGSHRLSYLGFNIDDRALGDLLSRPERMPDVVIYSREGLVWLADFDKRPARDAALLDSGFSYKEFQSFEALGYRLTEVLSPRFPWPMNARVFPWYAPGPIGDVMVYRRL